MSTFMTIMSPLNMQMDVSMHARLPCFIPPSFPGFGDAYSDGVHTSVSPGNVIIFPPGSRHGLDNNTGEKL